MTGKQVLKSIQIRNLLSFGDATEPLELLPLNVLVGPNGSGKSNLLTILDLLRQAPRDISTPIAQSGGINEWLWKGGTKETGATLFLQLDCFNYPIRYSLSVSSAIVPVFPILVDSENIARDTKEPLASSALCPAGHDPHSYYSNVDGKAIVFAIDRWRDWTPLQFNRGQSVLSQLKDPEAHIEVTLLGALLGEMKMYRAWTLGPGAGLRQPQPTDMANVGLQENAENLGLVLNRMRQHGELKQKMLQYVKMVFDGVTDVDVRVVANTVQVLLEERSLRTGIPASRLSDGTLRWLALLAVLLDPNPSVFLTQPSVVCIEEPELGLHPDLLPKLAELLVDASQRMQLIVTTHSEVLVDALTETPEAVVVCEKENGATTMKRLDQENLKEWLKKYSLGQLWRKGEIGGNRW